jgi:hypothetical protein
MAIIKKEAYFNSSTGVNKIRTLIWQDDDVAPVGVFQISHGVCEHIDIGIHIIHECLVYFLA